MTERMRELLRQWAQNLRSDEVSTDEFLSEGMTFTECLELMDRIAIAVEQYARTES